MEPYSEQAEPSAEPLTLKHFQLFGLERKRRHPLVGYELQATLPHRRKTNCKHAIPLGHVSITASCVI